SKFPYGYIPEPVLATDPPITIIPWEVFHSSLVFESPFRSTLLHESTIDIFLQLLSTSTLLLTPSTTESPSAAGIHPHAARRCGETSGCFPLCSSLAPGRRTAPESCRLPSPVPTLLPDGPAGSL